MKMPPELSLPVQRTLRTMISGVMLVQCFTVYVYLASYIVLLYPVFLVCLYDRFIKKNRNVYKVYIMSKEIVQHCAYNDDFAFINPVKKIT